MSDDIKLTNVSDEEGEVFMGARPQTRDMSQGELAPELTGVYNMLEGNNGERTNHARALYLKMLEKDPNAVCVKCRNNPPAGTICNVCRRTASALVAGKIPSLPEEVTNRVFIPDRYKQETFNPMKLRSSYPDLKDDFHFNRHVQILDSRARAFADKQPPVMSLYISAPSGFGKATWAYHCMQAGLVSGLKVFPYLDLLEARSLIDACENPNKKDSYGNELKKDIGFTDLDLYNADVCILKVPHGNDMHGAYKTMLQIIDRRARRGKSTIFLSRYRFDQFCHTDFFKEAYGLVTYDNPGPKNLQVYEVVYQRDIKFNYLQPDAGDIVIPKK